jgi:hypothetical protein
MFFTRKIVDKKRVNWINYPQIHRSLSTPQYVGQKRKTGLYIGDSKKELSKRFLIIEHFFHKRSELSTVLGELSTV